MRSVSNEPMFSTGAYFAEEGILQKRLTSFEPRPQQMAMAEAIERAFEEQALACIEAETGTGKTYAYLLPAFFSDRPVIVATASIALQEQLFQRDIPHLQHALGLSLKVALLKGRHRYLCRQRFQETLENPKYKEERWASLLDNIERWQKHSENGDLTQYPQPLEPYPGLLWRITATGDTCYGRTCPKYDTCFLVKARQQALDADLIVVNHHLLAAHVAMTEQSLGRFLPEDAHIVVDEAHHFPETLALFLGDRWSLRQWQDLQEGIEDAPLLYPSWQPVQAACRTLAKRTLTVQAFLTEARGSLPLEKTEVQDALTDVGKAYADLQQALETLIQQHDLPKDEQTRAVHFLERCQTQRARWERLQAASSTSAHWYQHHKEVFELLRTPMRLAPEQWRRGHKGAWVFTSATLTLRHAHEKDAFDYFLQRLGLDANSVRTLRFSSPFDYQKQARLYLPALPEPDQKTYLPALLAHLPALFRATRGRALCLFTSYAALDFVQKRLPAVLRQEKLSFPLFVQGEASKWQILQDFRACGNGILLATHSFWEGIDIPGEALSCVLIDRLPFSVPSEPLHAARIAYLRAQGRDPFLEYQLPQAILTLKQGIGRLIRHANDRGVIVLADARIRNRRYGAIILENLPPMPHCFNLSDVSAFFANMP